MEPFDVDIFITEIQNRPPICDSRLPEYSNKVMKKNAWEDVCKFFYADFEEKTTKEKNLACIELQKKWKSIKDAYNREKAIKRKCASSGSEAKFRKPYVYSKYLSFLDPLSEIRPSILCSTSSETSEQDASTEDRPIPLQKKPKKNLMIEESHDKLLEAITASIQKDDNPDKHFLLLLVPDFTSIQEDYKLEAKGEMINLIQKYKNMRQLSRYDMPGTSSQYGYQSGSGYTGYQTTQRLPENSTQSSLLNLDDYESPSNQRLPENSTQSSLLNLDDYESPSNQSDIITDMYE